MILDDEKPPSVPNIFGDSREVFCVEVSGGDQGWWSISGTHGECIPGRYHV